MASVHGTAPLPLYRHPLGLPAGSVRATLAIFIVALFWMVLLLPAGKPTTVPLYLYFLLGLVLVFFGSHGSSIEPAGTVEPSPWHLPRGTIRWFLVLGSLGIVGYLFYNDPDLLMSRLTPRQEQLAQWPHLVLALLGGFSLGWIARHGPWRRAYWFQDIQAWVSLMAMVFLVAEVVIQIFIKPNLEASLDLFLWECVLTAVVAFYFGVRCA